MTLHELPAGYSELRRYILTDRKLIIRLNIAALIPLAVGIVVMILWQMIVTMLRGAGVVQPLDFTLKLPSWIVNVLLVVLILPFHELLHGLAIGRVGHPVRYGIKLEYGVLYAMAEDKLFRRNEYLFVLLTPITVITLLGMLANAWLPNSLTFAVALAVVFNAGGAIGDLWMVWVLRRYPPSVIIRDDSTGFTVFSKNDE